MLNNWRNARRVFVAPAKQRSECQFVCISVKLRYPDVTVNAGITVRGAARAAFSYEHMNRGK